MSKKMMKRSLALGALMAFVITGQAWAAPSEYWFDDNGNHEFNEAVDVNWTGTDGVRAAYTSATFKQGATITVNGTSVEGDKKSYGVRALSDNGVDYQPSKVTFLGESTNITVDGINAFGVVASYNSESYVDLSSKNVTITVNGSGYAQGIIAQYGASVIASSANTDILLDVTVNAVSDAYGMRVSDNGTITASSTTDVNINVVSQESEAIGVWNGRLGSITLNGDVSITAKSNAKAEWSYAVQNWTGAGTTTIGTADTSKVVIDGNVLAYDGTINLNLGTADSVLTGVVTNKYTNGNTNSGISNLNFAKGATWNLTGASIVNDATFKSDSVLNLVEGSKYVVGSDYALTGSGTLTVQQDAKLQIGNIKETTYQVAKGFTTVVNEHDGYWTLDNNLMQGTWSGNADIGLDLIVEAKKADEIAKDMGVDSGTASALGSIIEAANKAGNVEGTPAANVVEFAEKIANASPEVAAAAAEAVIKMAEAGGNSATAANIVKNVTGVTNDRLSFNCGHSAPHKGGHGVGLFEEGSGADIWAEYVHGKDKVEDMKSTAGATSYEGQYNGFVMGVDFKKVNKFQSGIAFNYGEGDTNTVGSAVRTRSDYDFWGIGYYGNIHNDDSNVIFDINYAQTDSDVTQKNITCDIEASPETTTWSAGVKLEKLYQNENVQIVPYTGLRYMSIDPDDYATKCGTYKYSMDRQDIWLLPVGVSIRQEIANDNGWTVSPRVDLSYIWAFGDTDSNMEFATALNTKTNIGYDVMDDGSFLGLVGIEAHKGQWGYGVSYSYQKGDHSESKKWYVDVNYSF